MTVSPLFNQGEQVILKSLGQVKNNDIRISEVGRFYKKRRILKNQLISILEMSRKNNLAIN